VSENSISRVAGKYACCQLLSVRVGSFNFDIRKPLYFSTLISEGVRTPQFKLCAVLCTHASLSNVKIIGSVDFDASWYEDYALRRCQKAIFIFIFDFQ
jgi:hypothetical protein